jgi:hypothetical protein
MRGGEVEYTGEWKPTPWIPIAAAHLIGKKAKMWDRERRK